MTGVSRSGRVRKKSSKLLDFQSPDDVERKIYKRTTNSPKATTGRHTGRGRPSLAAMKARKLTRSIAEEENDVAADDNEIEKEVNDDKMVMDIDKTEKDEGECVEEEADINDIIQNTSGLMPSSDTDDDGFGELVADFVGSETTNMEGGTANQKSNFRQSLYMTEKNKKLKENRLERKDKGKARFTAYNMWAREHRKSNKFGKANDMEHQAARRLHELWSNVSNKEKTAWKRKAKMQASRVKQKEKTALTNNNKTIATTTTTAVAQANQNQNSIFINRPTTSRTRKLAEDKQKAKDDLAVVKTSPVINSPRKTRNNSYKRNHNNSNSEANINTLRDDNTRSPLYITTNGSTNILNNSSKASTTLNNMKTPLPTIEPIDAAAHLKLLGESLSIIGDRLKEHEGQIAVSGSLSVLLDSLLCSLGPLLCLTTRLPGLDKKPQLKVNLATTLDNIAYVMPGL